MDPPTTLPFGTFWQWLMTHPNCIIRAGTPDAVIYDDEDMYWHFVAFGGGNMGVQILRGKRYFGELFVDPERIAYVQGMGGEVEEEYVFELITETESDRKVAYFFVLAHGYEDEQEVSPGRVH